MPVTEATTPMTTAQLLALPEDGVERWLIRGQLREKPKRFRNRFNSQVLVCIGCFLQDWLEQQPQPRGSVLCGNAGVRLTCDPDTTVGVDVAYVSAESAAHQPDDMPLYDGPPVLVVEILVSSDPLEMIDEKIDEYLAVGVPLVWIIDPYTRTVAIYRPDEEPQLVNASQELSGEPHLPGFHVAVADLFA